MSNRSDDEIFVEVCNIVEDDFVTDTQKVFDLVGSMKTRTGYGTRGDFSLSILYDYTKKGMLKKEEFIRGVRAICTGEIEESRDKSRARRGRTKTGKRKAQKLKSTGKMKVVCQLDGPVYHNNKDKFHKLADKYQLERKGGWNKDLNAALLHWRTTDFSESIHGFFKRVGNVTTEATLTWRGEQPTRLAQDFAGVCRELNGDLDDSELKYRESQAKLFEF